MFILCHSLQNFKFTQVFTDHICHLAVSVLALKTPFKIISQQSTHESKRRASKEATAVSKEGSEDPEPENVCDER